MIEEAKKNDEEINSFMNSELEKAKKELEKSKKELEEVKKSS